MEGENHDRNCSNGQASRIDKCHWNWKCVASGNAELLVIKFLRVAARWWVRFRLSDAIGKGGYNLTTELIGSEDYFRIAD
jgi:hypothetical protein